MIPLILTMIPGLGRSEVVIIYPDIYVYTLWWTNILPWKITMFNGILSTISMAIFNSFLYVHQAGYILFSIPWNAPWSSLSASLRQRNRSAQGCPGAQNLESASRSWRCSWGSDGYFMVISLFFFHGISVGILWIFMAISLGFCGDIMIIMGFSRMLAAIW